MQSRRTNPYSNQRGSGRGKQLRNWLILLAAVALGLGVVTLVSRASRSSTLTATLLPCYASQSVTPFGDQVLYYDSVSLHCLSAGGRVRWSSQIGEEGGFHASDGSVITWNGDKLSILNQAGSPSYDDNLGETIQFARVGKQYAAVILGKDTAPTLVVRDLGGAHVDEEIEAFNGMLILDAGFYGDQGQYMWTLSLDAYGTVANTVLNTFEVGKMNTGIVSLGDAITYKALFENNRLRVISTRQMRTFDYKGVENATASMLVYGWKLIGMEQPQRGDAYLLFAPSSQTNNSYAITELRLLAGDMDRRFTLPGACVGAVVHHKSVYAFSDDYIYRAGVSAQRFSLLSNPITQGKITAVLGMLSDGRALVAAGDDVYAVTLPS